MKGEKRVRIGDPAIAGKKGKQTKKQKGASREQKKEEQQKKTVGESQERKKEKGIGKAHSS